MALKIDDLLRVATSHNASDLHLKVGAFPVMRIGGELHPVENAPRLKPEDTLDMAFSIMSNRQKQRFKEISEVDIGYGVSGLGRFRANIFQQRGTVSIVLRVIPDMTKSAAQLGLPPVIDKIAEERRGLILVTGATGSGKSTTMNILGCLDRPTRGTYILDGDDVSELSKDERADIRCSKIGFVFQGFNLLSRTSALENVELPMLYLGVDTATRHQRALEALASVGLAGREQNHPNQLSGGQQQRVAVARSLVNNPALILADEPTGNLDSRTSVEVMEIFQRLNRERGITLVLVTHEPDIAEYASRVVVFKDGKIKSDRQVEKPRNAAEELKHLPVLDESDDDEE